MGEKKTTEKAQDREFVERRREGSLAGTNGNGAGTRQLPTDVAEPEADFGDTAHEDEGQKVKDTSTGQKGISKRYILFGVIGLVLIVGGATGVRYWLHSRLYESTDDAFIEGHATQVSPKVSGYVQRIYITDNQQVKAGDLLVEIDPRDYEVRLAQARAALSAATARSKAARAGLTLTHVTAGAGVEQASAGVEAAHSGVTQARAASSAAEGRVNQLSAAVGTAEANVAQAQAQVVAAEAEAVRARADVLRYQPLLDQGAVSRQQLDYATAAAATADAQLEAARRRGPAAEARGGEAAAAQGAHAGAD